VDRRRHDVRRLVERRGQLLRRAAAEPADEVAGMLRMHQLGRLVRGRVVRDRRQRVVVDDHQFGCVLGEVPVRRDHQRDRVPDESHLAVRQGRPRDVRKILAHHRVPLLAHARIEVRGGEDRVHAVERERLVDIDLHDAAARERAAHEARMQHPGPDDVVHEGPAAGQQPGILGAVNAGPGVPRGGSVHRAGRLHRRSPLRLSRQAPLLRVDRAPAHATALIDRADRPR
jgi:hypothetical protein